MTTQNRHETGCVDGYLPVSPIDRRPSTTPCYLCEEDKVTTQNDSKTPYINDGCPIPAVRTAIEAARGA